MGEGLGERANVPHTVTLQDGIGRQSGVGFSVIRDTTPPTLTLAAVVQGTDVHVTWNVEDSGSGVDAGTCLLEVREDEGTWQTFSTECGGDDRGSGNPSARKTKGAKADSFSPLWYNTCGEKGFWQGGTQWTLDEDKHLNKGEPRC